MTILEPKDTQYQSLLLIKSGNKNDNNTCYSKYSLFILISACFAVFMLIYFSTYLNTYYLHLYTYSYNKNKPINSIDTRYPIVSDRNSTKLDLTLKFSSITNKFAECSEIITFKSKSLYKSIQLDSSHSTIRIKRIFLYIDSVKIDTEFSTSIPNRILIKIKEESQLMSKYKQSNSIEFLYQISIHFKVKITNTMKGFYKSESSNGNYMSCFVSR